MQADDITVEDLASGHQNGAGASWLRVGARVRPRDRNNVGKILTIDGDAVDVHFVSPDGAEATRTFSREELTPADDPSAGAAGSLPPPALRILSAAEVLELPPPSWLIRRLLPERALVTLYGAPAAGKSFFALDLALSVATGQSWHGYPVRAGRIVYIAAEGAHGLGRRMRAWLEHHRRRQEDLERFHAITEAPELVSGAHVDALWGVLQGLSEAPALLVVDTLARCIIPGDENSAKDMGLLVRGADRIRAELGCTVILVHHMSKDGKSERGSSALRGASDTMVQLTAREGDAGQRRVLASMRKQKDAEPLGDMLFGLEPVEIPGERDEEGGPVTSCVLTGEGTVIVSDSKPGYDPRFLCSQLLSAFTESGATNSQWKTVYLDCKGANEATYYRHKKWLVQKGYVNEPEKRGGRFTLSEKGSDWLA